jgi:predicted enzyme related to lactoylglutathione lyase
MAEAPLPIESLETVTVHIRDVEKARHFYASVLGLKEIAFVPEAQRLVFALPGSGVSLSMHVMSDPREEGREPGTVSGIVFGHQDPAAALAELKKRGGTVIREVSLLPNGLLRGVFADPDGNEFVLMTRR